MEKGTIIVGLILLAIVVLIVVRMIRKAKQSAACGGGCCDCPLASRCVRTNDKDLPTLPITIDK